MNRSEQDKLNEDNFLESDEFFFASLEWEREWKKSLPKLNDKELIEVFQVPKETLQEKLIEWQEDHDASTTEIKRKYSFVPQENEWFFDIIFKHLEIPKLLVGEKHTLRLKRQLAIINGPTDGNYRRWQNMQELIAVAKTRPIHELARSKLEIRPSGKNFVALCPFHNEKTPSCYFYTETNTFYCFGCQEGGDVITFIQHLYGVDFKEAVRMIT